MPTAWQPIETAPKDGTIILVGWRGECWLCFPAMWRASNVSHGLYGWHYLTLEKTCKPTHWMPLPEPPTE